MCRHHPFLLCLTVLLAAAGCGKKDGEAKSRDSLRVFVAASTKEAVEEIAVLFTKDAGVEVKVIAEVEVVHTFDESWWTGPQGFSFLPSSAASATSSRTICCFPI